MRRSGDEDLVDRSLVRNREISGNEDVNGVSILDIGYRRYIDWQNYILDIGYRVIYRDMVLNIERQIERHTE